MTLKGLVRRIDGISRRWEEVEKAAGRWPAGSSKGGQFAPKGVGGGSAPEPRGRQNPVAVYTSIGERGSQAFQRAFEQNHDLIVWHGRSSRRLDEILANGLDAPASKAQDRTRDRDKGALMIAGSRHDAASFAKMSLQKHLEANPDDKSAAGVVFAIRVPREQMWMMDWGHHYDTWAKVEGGRIPADWIEGYELHKQDGTRSFTRLRKAADDGLTYVWAVLTEMDAGSIKKANWHRWPAGAPSSKGGQFAPSNSGAGGGGIKAPQYGMGNASGQQSFFSTLYGGEDKPKGPPPGAKPHTQKDDKGNPVTINYPTKPSDPQTWADPRATATFTPGSATPDALNGVAFKSWKAPTDIDGWSKVAGQNPKVDADFPFEPAPGKNVGAGVIIREPDGRLWITRPTNRFGGYEHTFPKGTVEQGLSLQASAIKEAYEETGLKVKIVGVLGDYERTTSKARYYIAERVGGTPADMGWESQAMRLVPAGKLPQYLNRQVDKDIAADFNGEMLLKRLAKAAKGGGAGRKGSYNPDQPRWPAGSPLGGQWVKVGTDGVVIPPTIAGGLEGKNPAYQKKANTAHKMAQAGEKVVLAASLAALTEKVAADKAGGKTSSHVKWTAQLHQYIEKLVADLTAAPKAWASADAITGPMKLSAMTYAAPKPGGSNPGDIYTAGGEKWLVKGNLKLTQGAVTQAVSDDRAKNEVLAAQLMNAVSNGSATDMRLVELGSKYGGGMGVASKMVDGVVSFNAANAAHVAAIQKDYALHAWLGNYDVIGTGFDNTVIDKATGKAINIDPGGAILFRAQGLPKDAFGKDASEWETMRVTTGEQKAVFGKMTQTQLQESAKALALIDDATVKKLVDTYGPGDAKGKADLAETLIARRDAILKKAGLTGSPAVPAPSPPVPNIVDAVSANAGPSDALPAGVKKPSWGHVVEPGIKTYYEGLTDKIEAAYKAGDLTALKALDTKKNGTQAWPAGSLNGKTMGAYHAALVADLEKKAAQKVQAVAAGADAVAGSDGKIWEGSNGVLKPVRVPQFDNTVQGMGMTNGAQIKAALYTFGVQNGGKTFGQDLVDDYTKVGAASLKGSPLSTLIMQAEAADYTAILNAKLDPNSAAGKFRANLVDALSSSTQVAAQPQGMTPAPAAVATPAPSGKALDKAKVKAIIDRIYVSGKAGDDFMTGKLSPDSLVGELSALAMKGDAVGLSLYDTQGAVSAGKLKTALLNAVEGKATATKPAGKLDPQQVMNAARDAFGNPFKALVNEIAGGYSGIGSPTGLMVAAALKGDVSDLAGIAPANPKQQAFKNSLLAAMGQPEKSVSQAAAAAATATSSAQLNAALAAMPNFEKAKLPPTNANAGSHNAKVDTIAALAGKGDEKGLLKLNFGTNTYGKQQAKLANAALAAMGSVHTVAPGQKANAHPALTGGSSQGFVGAPPPQVAKPAATASAAPTKVVVTPDKLSKKPDFLNWNGQGKGLSSSAAVNEANAKAVDAIEAMALTGDFAALKGMTYAEVNKETGQLTGKMKTFGEHPSKHVQSYFYDTIAAVEDIVNPPKPLAAFNTKTAKGVDDVAAHFAPAKLGTVVHKQPQDHQFGFFLALGAVRNPEVLKPAAVKDFTPAEVKQGYADYKAYSSDTKQFISHIQGSGAFNDAYREGKSHYHGSDLKKLAQAVYKDATEMPAGTTIYRWQNMPAGMLKQIEKTAPGVVFQATGPMCTSFSPTATSGFGKHRMTIRYAKGAKAIHSFGSGSFSGEKEVSTLPGARFVFLGKTKMANGGWDIEVLMLPPIAPL